MNKYTVQDTLLSLNVNDFAEEFAEMSIMSLIDFFSDYDQIELDSESRDMTVFQTSLELFQQTTLSMKAINSPTQFSHIVMRVLEFCIFKDCEMYFDNIDCKDLKTKYNEKEILSGI